MGYAGQDHRKGAKTFSFLNWRVQTFILKNIRGRTLFFRKNKEGEDFFPTKNSEPKTFFWQIFPKTQPRYPENFDRSL